MNQRDDRPNKKSKWRRILSIYRKDIIEKTARKNLNTPSQSEVDCYFDIVFIILPLQFVEAKRDDKTSEDFGYDICPAVFLIDVIIFKIFKKVHVFFNCNLFYFAYQEKTA